MMHLKLSRFRDESGAVAVMAALILVVVLGFTALVIDIGQIILAKQECQNAADSGALAGARHLVPYLTSTPPIPDWYNAQTVATEAVTANRSNHILLTDCNVQAGYWNLINKVLKSTSIVPTLLDVPAVRVNVARAPEQNTGPVLMTFARIFGINIANVSAQATAMLPCPGSAPKNSLFPIAIAEALLKAHWYSDPPFTFNIGSDYHYPDDQAGQWTSFKQDINNVDYVHSLINNGNPDTINLFENIWIQPGTETALYNHVKTKVVDMVSKGLDPIVFVPVVNTNFETHNFTPVLAIAPIYIEDVFGGEKKYIKAHFVREALFPTNNVKGPCYGGFVPPVMVN